MRLPTAVVCLFLSSAPLTAQESTLGLLRSTTDLIAQAEKRGDELVTLQVERMTKGQSRSHTFTLPGGHKYHATAQGNTDRFQALFLEVYDATGKLVGKDTIGDFIPMVVFDVPKEEKFTFKVTPAKMKGEASEGYYSFYITKQKKK